MDCPSASADLSLPGLKETMLKFLKLSGRADMVAPVEKYCDEKHGIVFNRHPATDEQSFANLREFRCICRSKSAFPSQLPVKSGQFSSPDLHETRLRHLTSRASSPSPRLYRLVKRRDPVPREVVQVVDRPRTFIGSQRASRRRGSTGQILASRAGVHVSNSEFDLITTKGRGRLLNHVGSYHVLVQLENNAQTCFPLKSVQFYDSYIKRHPTSSALYNYQMVDSNRVNKLMRDRRQRMKEFDMMERSLTPVDSQESQNSDSEKRSSEERFRNHFEKREYLAYGRKYQYRTEPVLIPDMSRMDSRSSWSDICEYNE